MKNCIIKSWFEEIGDAYFNGLGWSVDMEKAKRFSLPQVELIVEQMRDDDLMVFWERYDKTRTSL